MIPEAKLHTIEILTDLLNKIVKDEVQTVHITQKWGYETLPILGSVFPIHHPNGQFSVTFDCNFPEVEKEPALEDDPNWLEKVKEFFGEAEDDDLTEWAEDMGAVDELNDNEFYAMKD